LGCAGVLHVWMLYVVFFSSSVVHDSHGRCRRSRTDNSHILTRKSIDVSSLLHSLKKRHAQGMNEHECVSTYREESNKTLRYRLGNVKRKLPYLPWFSPVTCNYNNSVGTCEKEKRPVMRRVCPVAEVITDES
jgi:hypothetical protein